MFTAFLLGALAIAYIVLKTLNTKARFEEADARRLAEEQRAKAAAEEAAEEEQMRAEAIDVDPEVIDNEAADEGPERAEEEE
ncbi:MAG: hypothetical protein GX860_10115 [Alcaligenaceae bacterium]|nr:hypothetical protein [Alcaligenaceae bacterium]